MLLTRLLVVMNIDVSATQRLGRQHYCQCAATDTAIADTVLLSGQSNQLQLALSVCVKALQVGKMHQENLCKNLCKAIWNRPKNRVE